MKFVVDGMLGGLARWLRMLGYETEYDSKMDDNALLEKLQSNEAILLTRDQELYSRATKRKMLSVLVRGETAEARLVHLNRELGIPLEINMSSTRCPQCGSELRTLSRPEASKAVPAGSLERYDLFWKCTGKECGKTYWIGSHWKDIRRTLERARRIAAGEKTV